MWDYICYPNTGLDKRFVLQQVEAPTISRQSAHEVGKDVSHTHSPLYPQMTLLTLIFV